MRGMRQSELAVGMLVRTNFADPGLPEGSAGEVVTVHGDPVDGVDVRLSDGRLVNALAQGLDQVAQPGR